MLWKLSWRALQQDAKRTILTILAMGLAATLACAVLLGFASAQTSMYDYITKETNGTSVAFSALTTKQAQAVRQSPDFGRTMSFYDLGKVAINNEKSNEATAAFTQTAMTAGDLRHVELIAGRRPKTAHEALIPASMMNKKLTLGDIVTVTHGGQTSQYRAVGTINNYQHGFLKGGVVTLPTGHGKLTVAVEPKHFLNLNRNVRHFAEAQHIPAKAIRTFDDALTVMGQGKDKLTAAALAGTMVAILAIVGVAALVMIYTSINLAVRAQAQYFGLLRSLGTTPKQLRQLVYLQAGLLIIPALALGGLFGAGGMAVVLRIVNRIFTANEIDFPLQFTFSGWPLALAALFMVLVTFLASARPAWRASRMSPIAGIRGEAVAISPRRLKDPRWLRFLPNPLWRLAEKFYRRSGQKATMLTTLTLAIALFIGLTGFIRETVQNHAVPGPDIYLYSDAFDQRATAEKALASMSNIRSSAIIAAIDGDELTAGGKTSYGNLFIVSDAAFARDFGGHPTLLTGTMPVKTKAGLRTQWQFPRHFNGRAHFKAGHYKLALNVRTITAAALPAAYRLLWDDSASGVIVSASAAAKWQRAKQLPKATVTQGAVTLKDTKLHKQTTVQLKNAVPALQVTDEFAFNQENIGTTAAIRVFAYGFIALLTLVSLATIINHTFSALIARKRELAMLQSVGMTARQLTWMSQLQSARLLGAGFIGGFIIAVIAQTGLSHLLYPSVPLTIHWPLQEAGIAAAALLVIWLGFYWFTWRMLRHQDIDQLIRIG